MSRPSRMSASSALALIGQRSGGMRSAIVKFFVMLADGGLPAWDIKGYPRGRRLSPRLGGALKPIDLQHNLFVLPSGRTIELVVDRIAIERVLPLVRDDSHEDVDLQPSTPPLSESVFVLPKKIKPRDRRGRKPGDGRIKCVSYAMLFPAIDAMMVQHKSPWAACRQLARENKIPGLLDGKCSEDYQLSLAKRVHRIYKAWVRCGRPPL